MKNKHNNQLYTKSYSIMTYFYINNFSELQSNPGIYYLLHSVGNIEQQDQSNRNDLCTRFKTDKNSPWTSFTENTKPVLTNS